MSPSTLRLTATVLLLAGGLGACQAFGPGALVRDDQCQDIGVEIYFEPASATLGPDAQALIDQAATQAKGCRVTTVEVLGLADAPGASGANLDLSKERADAVRAALAAARLPAAQFHVRAAGDAGALTPDGLPRPMRRRVDVTLRLEDAS